MRIRGVRTVLFEYPPGGPWATCSRPGWSGWRSSRSSWRPTRSLSGWPSAGRGGAGHPRAGGGARRSDPRAVRALYELMQRLGSSRAGRRCRGERAGDARTAPCGTCGPRSTACRCGASWARAPARVAVYASGLDMPLTDDELRTLLPGLGREPRHPGGQAQGGPRPRVATCQRLAIMRDALREGSGRQDVEPDDRCQRVLVAQAGDPAHHRASRRSSTWCGRRSRSAATTIAGLARVSRGLRTGRRDRREPHRGRASSCRC